MKANLLPLEGKYYGTRVLLLSDDGSESWIMIWHTDSSGPSEREIAIWDVMPDNYHNVYDSWDEVLADYICDSHYESRTAYEVALKIVDAVNGAEV